jgi:signal recognition particle receptor subunit beta
MVLFNYATKELTLKVVYYGPGLGGKTTNLQQLHSRLNPKTRGKLISLATEMDRTLFFDFLPMELGTIQGFKVRFQLYTVPGQVYYNATRKLVLKGADSVIFVADSQEEMMERNLESLQNLKENLLLNNLDPETIPMVFQYNKRDLPKILPVSVLNAQINHRRLPSFEAIAITGMGVVETFKETARVLIKEMGKRHRFATPREEMVVEAEEVVEEAQPSQAETEALAASRSASAWVEGSPPQAGEIEVLSDETAPLEGEVVTFPREEFVQTEEPVAVELEPSPTVVEPPAPPEGLAPARPAGGIPQPTLIEAEDLIRKLQESIRDALAYLPERIATIDEVQQQVRDLAERVQQALTQIKALSDLARHSQTALHSMTAEHGRKLQEIQEAIVRLQARQQALEEAFRERPRGWFRW